ncbi:MAG: ATP-binding protein [Elusimicrobiota bacterium]|jgi:two-component system phosphate regulon sensor histidine kinase PhoR
MSSRARIRLIILAVAALSAALTGFAGWRSARVHLVEELAEGLLERTRLLARELPAERSGTAALAAWVSRSAPIADARISLIAPDGRLLADSSLKPDGLARAENHADRPEFVAARRGGKGTALRHSHSTGMDFLYAAAPVSERPDAPVLRLAMPLGRVDEALSRMRRTVVYYAFIALLFALFFAAFAAALLHRPVELLAEAADRMAAGIGLPSQRGKDELDRLAEVLHELALKSSGALQALGEEKSRLQATLAHMAEGVAVVDAEGRLREVNPAMEALFGLEAARARGVPLIEVLRHGELKTLLDRAAAGTAPVSGELTVFTPEERVFEAHATPILENGRPHGTVLVLHDITRLRRLEEMRRDFVANVSHELRTPLASIKGFAETLRRGALEDAEHRLEFVGTIETQADRLTRLVDDLLELASVESGRRPLRLERVELGTFARDVAASLAPLAEKRRVRVEVAADAGLAVKADPSALRLLLQNLLDNAIKYNREGGEVRVSASREGASVDLCVSDTGLGIPAADLPRVFERFYRVDKARSRELGGTGLGLAIVKHLAEAHGGRVRAESVEGSGSSFHAVLPAA